MVLTEFVISKFFQKSEYLGLANLYKNSPQNRRQLNSFNTADAEIIQLQKNRYLALTTDSIAIEIHSGLYKNPETWGYLAVANSVSDLAATGSKPIGMLVSAQWKPAHQNEFKNRTYRAMARALRDFEIPLLGGDSGSSAETVLTTTLLGESAFKPLTRLGIKPGDLILGFGNFFGYGPTLAFDYLKYKNKNSWENRFRPKPNWKNTYKFRKYFKAGIDSSDGIFNSLQTLGALNSVQFSIDLSNFKLPAAVSKYKIEKNIPLTYFIESDLGDLQTIVAIDPKIYSKIGNKLPIHQVLAKTEKPTLRSGFVAYKGQSFPKAYKNLPSLIERSHNRYLTAVNQWLSQFKNS